MDFTSLTRFIKLKMEEWNAPAFFILFSSNTDNFKL
jgi:hypothetical protein